MSALLIKKAKILGGRGIEEGSVADLLIDGEGYIADIGRGLEAPEGVSIIDGEGSYVSPGWIDLHTHVYYGGTDLSIQPSEVGPSTGVHVLADAGSAGEANFIGFRDYVIQRHDFPIVSYLNVGSIGLVKTNHISELSGYKSFDIDNILKRVDDNREFIRGIKVRASHVILRDWGITPVKVAKKVAQLAHLPLVVHVGEVPPLLEEILPVLSEGDLVTHCYHGKLGGSIIVDSAVMDCVKDAVERGVLLDVGHGGASFSFPVAKIALQEGLAPFSISTDLHVFNVQGPVWDLATTMSKMLAVGLPLQDVIEAVTTKPAGFLGLEQYGHIEIGSKANFTLFHLLDKDLVAHDSQGNQLRLERFIQPWLVVRGTQTRKAASRNPAIK
mgnify:CR=1 FL=1